MRMPPRLTLRRPSASAKLKTARGTCASEHIEESCAFLPTEKASPIDMVMAWFRRSTMPMCLSTLSSGTHIPSIFEAFSRKMMGSTPGIRATMRTMTTRICQMCPFASSPSMTCDHRNTSTRPFLRMISCGSAPEGISWPRRASVLMLFSTGTIRPSFISSSWPATSSRRVQIRSIIS